MADKNTAINKGDPIEVPYRVTNNGGVTTTERVELYGPDGTQVSTTEVNVGPKNTVNGSIFGPDATESTAGVYEAVNNSTTVTVDVFAGKPPEELLVPLNDANLIRLDRNDGSKIWTHTLDGGKVYTAPSIDDGIAVVGDATALYGIDVTDGSRIWKLSESLSSYITTPLVVNGTAFALDFSNSQRDELRSIDISDGSVNWSYTIGDVADERVLGGISYHNGDIIAPTQDSSLGNHFLYSIDTETQSRNWSKSLNQKVESTPVAYNGYIGIVAGLRVDVIDTADGSTIASRTWSNTNGSGHEMSMTNNSLVYQNGPSTEVKFMDLDTGNLNYQVPFPETIQDDGGTVLYNGNVIVGDGAGTVLSYNIENGTENWKFTESSGYGFSPPTLFDSDVIIGDSDGVVYSLDAGTGEKNWSYQASARVRNATTSGGADGWNFSNMPGRHGLTKVQPTWF